MAISARDLGLDLLTGCRELRDLTDVGSLGSLSAGVGVDLGVEHEDVDVFAGGEDMVNAAEADIEGPAVAAEDPAGLLVQVILLLKYLGSESAGLAGAPLGACCLRGLRALKHLSVVGAGGEELDGLVDGVGVLFKRLDKLLGGLLVGVAVIVGFEPLPEPRSLSPRRSKERR